MTSSIGTSPPRSEPDLGDGLHLCPHLGGFVYVAFTPCCVRPEDPRLECRRDKAVELVDIPRRMALWQRDREGNPIVPGQLIGHRAPRLHSSLWMMAPMEFEHAHYATLNQRAATRIGAAETLGRLRVPSSQRTVLLVSTFAPCCYHTSRLLLPPLLFGANRPEAWWTWLEVKGAKLARVWENRDGMGRNRVSLDAGVCFSRRSRDSLH